MRVKPKFEGAKSFATEIASFLLFPASGARRYLIWRKKLEEAGQLSDLSQSNLFAIDHIARCLKPWFVATVNTIITSKAFHYPNRFLSEYDFEDAKRHGHAYSFVLGMFSSFTVFYFIFFFWDFKNKFLINQYSFDF